MMNSLPSTQQIAKAISHFLGRYHVLLFSIGVLGGLAAGTFVLYQRATTQSGGEQSAPTTTFDQTTIDKIKKLRGANDPAAPLTLPAGRTNPFM